jgi:hypothetical protein
MKDAPIEEIRQLRRQISDRFDNDPQKLVAHYLELQEQYRDRLIDSAGLAERNDQDAA